MAVIPDAPSLDLRAVIALTKAEQRLKRFRKTSAPRFTVGARANPSHTERYTMSERTNKAARGLRARARRSASQDAAGRWTMSTKVRSDRRSLLRAWRDALVRVTAADIQHGFARGRA